MQTIRFKSSLPLTSFAPQWDFTIGVFQLQDQEILDTIRRFLIHKEDHILSLKQGDNAGTGVGDDSITTRYGKYNLFDFQDECPELITLLEWLQTSFLEFAQHEASMPMELEIVCWYNILRDGAGMDEHIHSSQQSSYLSGNMQISEFNTQTNYRPPMCDTGKTLDGPSGQLVMFPSFVPHSVDHEYKGERISIAFDLYPTHLLVENWGKYRKFINEDIFKQLTSK
jgi:hypothetical protein|tara:strand:- start:4116 stop:4793 length:678 start_codon:yes stop_codon:yes gene_type:complete